MMATMATAVAVVVARLVGEVGGKVGAVGGKVSGVVDGCVFCLTPTYDRNCTDMQQEITLAARGLEELFFHCLRKVPPAHAPWV
jgi:hypothetical protein